MKVSNYDLILQLFLIALSFAPIVSALSTSPVQAQAVLQSSSRAHSEALLRPEVQRQKKDAEQEAERSLDKDGVAVITQTQRALLAMAENNYTEASSALERAIDRLDSLVSRNKTTALLPVAFDVQIIEAAPIDLKTIKERATAAKRALDHADYPSARVLLDSLTSEVRSRVANIPLSSYPVALKEALRLLKQERYDEAKNVLLTALHTLPVTDRSIPIPILVANIAIEQAQDLQETEKQRAKQLLATARYEIERARALGYGGQDPQYAALNRSISELDRKLSGTEDTDSLFAKLKERIRSFEAAVRDRTTSSTTKASS